MNRDAVLAWVTREVPLTVQDYLGGKQDSCVLSTRIGYDICRYFGVEAKPVVVRALAFNRQWEEAAVKHPELLTDPNPEKWKDGRLNGAWAVGVDEIDHGTPGRFAGHLILYAKGSPDYLLDLSLGQFRRTEYGMLFPDSLWGVPPDGFLRGEPFFMEYGTATIAYRYRPGVKTYTRGGDWRKHNTISGSLIRRAKSQAVRDSEAAVHEVSTESQARAETEWPPTHE